jgi:hypothetical protein
MTLVLVLGALPGSAGQAAEIVWASNGTGTWTTTGNWVGGGAASGVFDFTNSTDWSAGVNQVAGSLRKAEQWK